MARQTSSRDFSPIIGAAQQWAQRCLVEDGSLFNQEAIWTAANLAAVRTFFVNRPDEGGDDFMTKLSNQMANAPAGAQMLMAEMLWVTLLFPSNVSPGKKRNLIAQVLNLSGARFDEMNPLLSDTVLAGVGSAGQGFNNHRWRELVFLTEFAEHLKELPTDERRGVVSNYADYLMFVGTLPDTGHRQLRHMLRYFFFPDRVERMSSSRARRNVLQAFRGLSRAEAKLLDHQQLDDELLKLRRELETQHPGKRLDFYEAPLRSRWIKALDEEDSEADGADENSSAVEIDDATARQMWDVFRGEFPDFVDFAHPGERFPKAETIYKRRGLEKFVESGGRNEMQRLLRAGQPVEALQIVVRTVSLNIANYQSWRPSIGMDRPESLCEVLQAFLDATATAFEGPETLEPVFATLLKHDLAPAWDTTGVLLWALRPTDYFPIKISYYRALAERLGIELDSGRPNAERFDKVIRFGRAIWQVAASRAPQDWVDVQSFLWVLCQKFESDSAQLIARKKAANIWMIAPGEQARLWEEFYAQGAIGIGWDNLGDLRDYASKDEIAASLQAQNPNAGTQKNNAHCCWEFARVIQPGDIVVAKSGRSRVLGIGRVKSDYLHCPERSEYAHLRSVDWLRKGEWEIDDTLALKTLTNVTAFPDFVKRLLVTIGMPELFRELYGTEITVEEEHKVAQVEEPRETEAFDREAALARLFMSDQTFDDILMQLRRKKNVILQGPPGVGKTYVAETIAYALMNEKAPERVQMVQFHQSYGYEEFIQGLRPTSNSSYVVRPGIFQSFCEKAAGDNRPWVFIIDEINRGNLSKIFGELMMLIEADKRTKKFSLPLAYSDPGSEEFYVPENVHIIGLMNTADRSLAMVDYALRRRFAFITLAPEIESPKFKSFLISRGLDQARVSRLVATIKTLNETICADADDLGEGFCIGHSYFCPPKDTVDPEAWLESVLRYDIAPLLREYWMEREEKAKTAIADLEKLLA